ncbi:hypothetical protein KAJ83_10370 [Marivibrio halodurans]|uniref:Uncharacterized protein n=1 Tax=Marivibrio halodurans TaxID=2039722 RepID=A0A8J7V2Z9_9PROT|nr:hypothetical protein [Marivibrio halodurans]MBP5857412.1 hypothetical protein [Marivibrio halodurans]
MRITEIFEEKAGASFPFPGDEPGADQQERNAALRAKHDEQDDALIAKASGVLGASRMDLAGVGAAEDRRIEQAGKDKAKARHETNYLAALQAQLDQWGADIAALDSEIGNILDPYLTDAEREYLDGIDDPEEKAREQMRIAREKYENGTMPPEEFARVQDRWNERQRIRQARAEGAQIKTQDEARQYLEKYDAATGEAGIEGQSAELQDIMRDEVHNHDESGNAAQQNNASDFEVSSTGNVLGGNVLKGAGTSFANATESETSLREAAPPMRAHFEPAARQTGDVKPDAQINLAREHDADVPPPPNTMG